MRSRQRIRRRRAVERENQDQLVKLQYMEANDKCELKGLVTPPGGHQHDFHPHHIARIKWDIWECLLSVCWMCHTWGHERDREFVVWCLYAKWIKNELDLEKLNELKRGKRLQCYLEVEEGMLPETVRMINEMLAAGLGE